MFEGGIEKTNHFKRSEKKQSPRHGGEIVEKVKEFLGLCFFFKAFKEILNF